MLSRMSWVAGTVMVVTEEVDTELGKTLVISGVTVIHSSTSVASVSVLEGLVVGCFACVVGITVMVVSEVLGRDVGRSLVIFGTTVTDSSTSVVSDPVFEGFLRCSGAVV